MNRNQPSPTPPPPGTPDPLIEEVREARRRLSERFGNDIAKLAEHLRAVQEKHPSRVRKLDRGRRAG